MKWILFCGVLVCVARVAEFGALHKSDTDSSSGTTSDSDKPDSVPKHECRPGTKWSSQCNECHCTTRGRKRCTEKICDKEPQEEERHCAALTSWRNDCNTCFCTENGQPSCTEKACKEIVEPSPDATDALPKGNECAVGSKWKSQCNDCACSEDGLAFCTEKACISYENDRIQKCAPDSTWLNDCNTCWCRDGRAICTRIGCHGPIIELNLNKDEKVSLNKKEKDRESEQKEPLNKKEKEQESELIKHNIVKREVCKAKSTFQKDCNLCKCSEDGHSFHCSQSECMETLDKDVEVFMESEGKDHIERHTVCEPRSAFQIRCNDCVCNVDGTDYTCTNKPCPVPEDVELFHELRTTEPLKPAAAIEVSPLPKLLCNPNRMFVKDCNTCWCNENGTSYYCTRRVCTPNLPKEDGLEEKLEDLRVVKQECKPDEVFELDCNLCRCNSDGTSFSCTRRACFSETSDIGESENQNASVTRKTRAATAPAKETPKACTPGQEFRMDCNTCLCDNEGQDFSCTRIDCNSNNKSSRRRREVTNQDIEQCAPGSVFERECNVCRCDEDGHHAMCTTHRCEKPAETDKNEDNTVDSNFRCNAGEKFKRDCNDCTCSADGKSVFCTVNFCDKEIDNIKL